VFLVTRHFSGYQNFWHLGLGVWLPFSKLFPWLYVLNVHVLGLWYFTCVLISCEKTFPWKQTYLTLKILTLVFDQLFQNFNLCYIFWMIFQLNVPFHKTSPWEQTSLSFKPWPLCLTYFFKSLTLAISFEWYVLGLCYFTLVFLVTLALSMRTNIFDLVTLTLVFDLLFKNFSSTFDRYVLRLWYFT
jgi:hypothetical protein